MKNKTLILLFVAIAINLALALLPMYDASNIRSWIALGSSLASSGPVMANNLWPGGFFSFMAFTPMYLSYVYSGFSVYFAVVVLKLILFFFTGLTAFLLYRITQKIKPAYAEAVLLFTLFNPAILYINYFWAQIDILPVFFFTLGFALLRYVDFGGSTWKRYLAGFFPILISAFIYRYSLILIPALLLYDSDSFKQRIHGFLIAVGIAAALFGVEYVLFRGGLYNYVGALSGSVINMSGVEGFQYWLTIPQVPYIAFLVVLGFAVPFLFRALKYVESAALFFILLMFIYTSAVPLPDYFLWLYPVGVLLALNSASKLSFNKLMLLTGLPLYIGLFFISFIIGNGVQAGLFYFAYPLLHLNIAFFASDQAYANWVLVFNVFLLQAVLVSSIFCLSKSNREAASSSINLSGASRDWQFSFKPKTKAILAGLFAVLVLLSFGFNAVYSQPVGASDKQIFPLYLFPSMNNYDSHPLDSTYYLSSNGLVVYNNWSEPIWFRHDLDEHNANLSVSFDLQTDQYGSYNLFKADNYTMGVNVAPVVSISNMSKVDPVTFDGPMPQTVDVPVFDSKSVVYDFGLLTQLSYKLDDSSLGNYYVLAFKFKNDSMPQSLLLQFVNERCIFNLLVSPGWATVHYYDFVSNNQASNSTTYSLLSANGWNLLVFSPTFIGFNSWINNKPLHVQGGFFRGGGNWTVSSSGDLNSDLGGSVSQLYYDVSKPPIQVLNSFYIGNSLGDVTWVPLDSTDLTLSFQTTADGGIVQMGDFTQTLSSIDTVAFGKLTLGNYGLSVTLNYLELSQKSLGYYFVPVYFAVVVPFAVAFVSLWLLFKRRGNGVSGLP